MEYRKFALALGGWSARWLAHVGVLHYLIEKWFQPSLVSGTSIGAIVAAVYALGEDMEIIDDIVADNHLFSVIDLNPIKGIFTSDKVKKLLEPFYGNKTFADTKIPLRIVATCLTTWEKTIFSEWKILDAVCASISLPWVFSPYKIGDKYYIDGAIRENLPISACEGLPVIASSVTMAPGNPDIKNTSHFIRPFTAMYDAFTIMLNEQEALGIAATNDILTVEMRDPHVQYLNFKNSREAIPSGYQSASKSGIEKFLQNNK